MSTNKDTDEALRERLKALLDEYEYDFTLEGGSDGFADRVLAIVAELSRTGGERAALLESAMLRALEILGDKPEGRWAFGAAQVLKQALSGVEKQTSDLPLWQENAELRGDLLAARIDADQLRRQLAAVEAARAKTDRLRHLEGTPDETKLCYLRRELARLAEVDRKHMETIAAQAAELERLALIENVIANPIDPFTDLRHIAEIILDRAPVPPVPQAESQGTLSDEQRSAVVATWLSRHRRAIEQDKMWALNNLACDVLRAVDDLNHGRPLDVLGVLAEPQPSGEGTER